MFLHLYFSQLDQTHLGMPSRDYFLGEKDDKILRGYENFAKNVAKLLGATEDDAEEQIREMVDFEIKLANVSSFPAKLNLSSRESIKFAHKTVRRVY